MIRLVNGFTIVSSGPFFLFFIIPLQNQNQNQKKPVT